MTLGRSRSDCRLPAELLTVVPTRRHAGDPQGPRHCPTVFVYGGVGTQWLGMGAALMDIPPFRASLDACLEVSDALGRDLRPLFSASSDPALLEDPSLCLPAIVAVEVALTDVLAVAGIEPDFVVGHSLGETVCSYADGVLDRRDTMRLACCQGRVMKQAARGAMAALDLSWPEAGILCAR